MDFGGLSDTFGQVAAGEVAAGEKLTILLEKSVGIHSLTGATFNVDYTVAFVTTRSLCFEQLGDGGEDYPIHVFGCAVGRLPIVLTVVERSSQLVFAHAPDLPWRGVPVVLEVQVRKFFCRNEACQRKAFTERLSRVTLPYRRQTTRLRAEQRRLCLECVGEAAARTSLRLGLSTSAKTLIRRVCRYQSSAAATPRLLGVDDWAMRKGQTYGTILVDLE